MNGIFLPAKASNARAREAEHARSNRAEIVRELAWGRISRRDLVKWGLFTSAGMLAPIGGLNPFVSKAFADGSGTPRSPLFGVQPFTQVMPRFDVLARNEVSAPEALAAERSQDPESVLWQSHARMRACHIELKSSSDFGFR